MKQTQYTTLFVLLMLLTSCGEDRSGEFYALIEDRMWIEQTMREHYLWYEEIPEIEEKDYFQEPATFFKSLLYKQALDGKGDKYSYMEEAPKATTEEEGRSLTLDRESTYGMEFELSSDPTRTTNHTFAHILYVLPDSPADKAGIKRGDWISAFNKKRVNSSNYQELKKGGSIALAREHIVMTENGIGWQSGDTLNLEPSVKMEINPFLVCNTIGIDGKKVAYLVYNEFSTGPNDKSDETEYIEQMISLFKEIKKEAPDEFILDLRYNNGGYLQCAQTLASLLAPAHALGKTFTSLTFNDKSDPQTSKYIFDPKLADANLDLDKIYILTGSHTASASEAVINGLIPYMGAENVILVGTKTEGKNVAMVSYKNEAYGLTLYPIVAYVSNAENKGDYINGFQPHYELDERSITPWYPLGDPKEYLLGNTLSLIFTGSTMDTPRTRTRATNVERSSIESRGLIIN